MKTQEPVFTSKAPKPIGPYSQAIRVGGFVFCSGQIALDAEKNTVTETTVEGQTQKVMKNMTAVLEAAGSGLDKVVKTTIFLKSMNDFPKVNEVYGTFFKENPPARSTVEVSRLPKDVLVEIEAVAWV
jgi:2-iminobutanoate/2-iminopropanoate deaminase